MGECSEAEVLVNNIPVRCLLDTGSTVSTVSQKWYDTHLSDVPIKSLDTILEIECTDGQNLPYTGYIEVEIGHETASSTCLLLIIPNSRYNEQVPLLLGTNVLQYFIEQFEELFGPRFLQTSNLKTPWYLAFRTMVLRERESRRKKFRLGIVKCAESKSITLSPNNYEQGFGYSAYVTTL